jgi:hypothetical protein
MAGDISGNRFFPVLLLEIGLNEYQMLSLGSSKNGLL